VAELMRWWQHDPLARLGIMVVGALLLALVLRLLSYALLRRFARRHPIAVSMLRRASRPMDWLVPLLMLVVALRVLPDADALPAFVLIQHVLVVALLIAATWLALRCVGTLEMVAIRRYPLDVADNLAARRMITQVRVLRRTADVLLLLLGASAILLTIPGVRQIGTSLLASAGVAGLALGIAAKPVLSNLIAGLQIAITQPIRLDDVVIIQGEWGRIEEITGAYVVVKIWDERRLVVPLQWFIENPFENWTRTNAQLIGTVFLWMDYSLPLEPLRRELQKICEAAPEWDKRVCILQVTDATERAMQVRALVSARDSGLAWDLRCRVREGLIAFLQREHPEALPRIRAQLTDAAPVHDERSAEHDASDERATALGKATPEAPSSTG